VRRLTLFLLQRSGKLLNMVGRGYKGPVPYQNAYGASKAWVLSFGWVMNKVNYSCQPTVWIEQIQANLQPDPASHH
jgi:short-subunit dehydrogenase